MTATGDVVIIDDDQDFANSLTQLLEVEGHSVTHYSNPLTALDNIPQDYAGVVILDIRMPRISGVEVLVQLLERDRTLPVIHVTGHGDIPMAVNALKEGAYGFFAKPLQTEEFLRDVNRALISRHTELERRHLARQIKMRDDLYDLVIGSSDVMFRLRQRILAIGSADVDVLITGETGTGKEVIAQALTRVSTRSSGPFVAVNCGTLDEQRGVELLFGLETLLPSGELIVQPGRLEQANGGTLLLDEIESMPQAMQVRLLRVLQERTFERVNSNSGLPLDIRILATTKSDLGMLVKNQQFRQDLYYRLNGAVIVVPPLRERSADPVMLFEHFLQQQPDSSVDVTPSLMSDLLSHDWPGNVRELQNAANRFAAGLSVFDESRDNERRNSLSARVADFERGLIEATLTHHQGSVKRTMLDLDIPRKTLYDKMTRHGLRKEDYQG